MIDQTPIQIAVSGDPGSFSEEAGRLYAARVGRDPDIHFAVDAAGVLNAVTSGKTPYGIFPVVNSRGGLVRMAFEAMGNYSFEVIDEVWFEVYQCLLHKPGIARNQITQIASHPQALKQCERYLKQEYPRATLLEWSDTAQAAKDLAEGTLPEYTAVIAPSRSAQIYGLEFLDRGIQDAHPNLTTFIIVQPKQQT